MLNALRRQLNPATAMAFIALVFATTGGAYAVTSHNGGGAGATTAKKKSKATGRPGSRGPAGPKGETGPAGPAGPGGPAGPAGAKGETGAAGAKGETGAAGNTGANGKDGESVSISKLEPGEGGCTEGGTEFTAGGRESAACNGEKGEAAAGGGYPKTLPEGETEAGTFAASTEDVKEEEKFVSISFAIPLPIAIEESHTHYVTFEEQENGKAPSECSGNASAPTAARGYLCVYQGFFRSEGFTVTGMFKASLGAGGLAGAGTAGALLHIAYKLPAGATPEEEKEEEHRIVGAWAVTAS